MAAVNACTLHLARKKKEFCLRETPGTPEQKEGCKILESSVGEKRGNLDTSSCQKFQKAGTVRSACAQVHWARGGR